LKFYEKPGIFPGFLFYIKFFVYFGNLFDFE